MMKRFPRLPRALKHTASSKHAARSDDSSAAPSRSQQVSQAAPQNTHGLRASVAQGWHNVILLFTSDMRHLMRNVIAAIVTVGLVLIPTTYAWFTTLGFWDPYSNTGELKVAVANTDEGYQSDLLPMRINAGDEVISSLRANDQFDWQFVDEEKAVDGVRSGEYYASLVIPKDFSANLMTVFSSHIEHSEIVYYSNEKENAIAPRVTSTGASTLQEEIDQSFTRTVADIALNSTSNLTSFMTGDGIANYGNNLLNRLNTTIDAMSAASQQVSLMGELVGSTSSLLTSTSDILAKAGVATETLQPLMDSAESGLADATSALYGINDLMDTAIAQANSSYDAISKAVDEAFKSVENAPAQADGLLNDLQQSVSDTKNAVEGLKGDDLPVGTNEALDQIITSLDNLSNALTEAEQAVDSSADSAKSAYQRTKDAITSAKAGIDSLHTTFDGELLNATSTFSNDLGSVKDIALTMANGLDETSAGLSATSGTLANSLDQVKCGLTDTAQVLSQATTDLTETRDALKDALDKHDLDAVRTIIGSDPQGIASFIAAPTKIEKHPVYAMANNGSSMSPFYSSLALWIGAIFMVALMSAIPSKRALAKLKDPKPWQLYLGRYGVFAVLAICQATVLCLGNVFFLGVQCEHFWLYMLTGWIAAIVFSNAVYTLTVSFGNIGKAIAIVLLVMQLGGSGGLFPIQMTAPVFQAIYPWLPFAHSMEAFESCMAGIYGSQYIVSILLLLAFLIPSAILGLALRNPVIRVVDFINEKLDETKVL